MTPAEIERLVYHMSAIAEQGSEWGQGFARSVIRQSRRRGWKPSPKQAKLMRRLVADHFAVERDRDFALIETWEAGS